MNAQSMQQRHTPNYDTKATDTTDSWASIMLAVEARAAYLKAAMQISIEVPWIWVPGISEHPYFRPALDLATASARAAVSAWRVPALLSDIAILATAYRVESTLGVRRSLAAVGNWHALGYSTPQAIVAKLTAGVALDIEQHTLSYDSENRVTWFTNPYGIDGLLCDEPTVECITRFLADMAEGRCYGAHPTEDWP